MGEGLTVTTGRLIHWLGSRVSSGTRGCTPVDFLAAAPGFVVLFMQFAKSVDYLYPCG